MALLFMDGFDHYAYGEQSLKYEWSVSHSMPTTGGRTGGYGSNGYVAKAVVADNTFICGFATTTMLGMGPGLGSHDWYQVYLTINANGSITVDRGGTVLATSAPGVFRNAAWNYIEFKVYIDNAAGTVLVKCNGATVINLTGQDTQNLASAGWDWCRFNFAGGTLDDMYLADGSGAQNNDLLGEVRVVTLLPSTGNGSNTDFTCSTSTDHGALVDDATPNNDTDYVYSSTLNHADSWNYPALGYTGSIKGVQMNLSARKTDSGTRALAAVTRPASTNRVHATNHYLTTSYTYWRSLWELNPEDSAAWEVADVDGAEFGVKITV